MMDELIAAVTRATGLTPDQSRLAVAAMMRFFTARLPSSLVGELHTRLQPHARANSAAPSHSDTTSEPKSTP